MLVHQEAKGGGMGCALGLLPPNGEIGGRRLIPGMGRALNHCLSEIQL